MDINTPSFTVRASQDQDDVYKRKLHVELTPVDRERGTILRFRRTGLTTVIDGTLTVTIDVTTEYDERACAQPDSYTIPYHVEETASNLKVLLRGDANQDIDVAIKSLAVLM